MTAPDPISIRKAIATDARQIADVHVQTWQETYRGILPADFLANLSVERRANYWDRAISDGTSAHAVHVAESASGEIVGFVAVGPERDQLADFDGELLAIYLLPNHQGKGAGRRLFFEGAYALSRGGHTSMALWVLKDNPTCGFYEHLGGTRVAEQQIEIAGQEFPEIAYGWQELKELVGR